MTHWWKIGGLAAALCLALGPVQAQDIGTVEIVEVWAYGTPPGGARQDRFVRDPVVQQELLETVDDGSMHVRFADGTELRLGSASQATLDSFVYSGSPGTGEMTANLTRGAFRFISGQINKSAVQLRTPTALIGIRGTDFIVNVAATGATVVSVVSGIVTVQSIAGGAASAVSVAAGQSVSVAPNATAAAPAVPTVMDPGLNAPAPGPTGPGTGVGSGAGGGGEAQGQDSGSSSSD